DRFYIGGKAAFWRLVGIGFVGFGLGAALGMALYGYSYVTTNAEHMSHLASAISTGLADVQLQAAAEGTVQLEPRELALAKNQAVSIDPNALLHLDPAAKITADGEVRVQVPSISLPQSAHPRPEFKVPTISNFTVFKSVPFDKGSVMTGWMF